ncbi:MAG: hypothetical protein E6559_04285 [Pantoea sp.]|uniref:hypothetical protein n=1 Tax=Pantoea septica TaxID=472695 RepID=UPI001C10C5E5|nr:hypothetical protein [Pantoea septica]MBU5379267.1 hypothetical protein [Pantoea septica]MDU5837210.1 hypothetical protein [Pantoea sp.]MDU6439121.1 hypothetical protein [Pantoea sp.]
MPEADVANISGIQALHKSISTSAFSGMNSGTPVAAPAEKGAFIYSLFTLKKEAVALFQPHVVNNNSVTVQWRFRFI